MTFGGPLGFCVGRASQVLMLLCALLLLSEFACEEYLSSSQLVFYKADRS